MIYKKVIKAFIKIRNVCSVKDTVKRMNRQVTIWEKIFANRILDKRLISRIYKELSKLSKKTNNLIKKWTKDLTRYFTKEDTLWQIST